MMMPCKCRDILESVKKVLIQSSATASVLNAEAESLVVGVVKRETGRGISRLELYANTPEGLLDAVLAEKILKAAQRRAEGEPLQYIVGYQTFLDHEYQVGPGVLIPRPETECLCLSVINQMEKRPGPILGLEIGLGSGVLSIELLLHFPKLKIVATELEASAKRYARINTQNLLGKESEQQKRLEILDVDSAIDVFEPVRRYCSQAEQRFDFLVSNPPYLLRDENEVDAQVVAHEPHAALFVEDPLYFYRKIAQEGDFFLKETGFVFLEIPHERAKRIHELFSKTGWHCTVQKDLTGRERVLIAQRNYFLR